MSAKTLQLERSGPIWMNKDNEKFWEISIDRNKTTIIRYGSLFKDGKEKKCCFLSEPHETFEEANEYATFFMNVKLKKGYKALPKETALPNKSTELIGKRVVEEVPSSPRSDVTKKFRTNDRQEIHINTQNEFQNSQMDLFDREEHTLEDLITLTQSREKKNNNEEEKMNFRKSKGFCVTLKSGNQTKFFQVHILDKNLKIEEGVEGDISSRIQYKSFSNQIDAENFAMKLVLNKFAKGYIFSLGKFRFNFEKSEIPKSVLSKPKLSRRKNDNLIPNSLESDSESESIGEPEIENDDDEEEEKDDYTTTQTDRDLDTSSSQYLMQSQIYSQIPSQLHSLSTTQLTDEFEPDFQTPIPSVPQTQAPTQTQTQIHSQIPSQLHTQTQTQTQTQLQPQEEFNFRNPSEAFKCLAKPSVWTREDPSKWYMSERLDGIRCFWTGSDLISHKGNQYTCPKEFTANFPKIPLDGLLYMGKGTLMACHNVVMKSRDSPEKWNKLKFIVYDSPQSGQPFEKRLRMLKEEIRPNPTAKCQLAEYKICQGKEHLIKELAKVEKERGAGIILKDPKALYSKGKSKGYFEARIQAEKEAVITGYKLEDDDLNVVKSFEVKNVDNGGEFSVFYGLPEELKVNPPPIGTIIIYKYSGEITAGKPKSPVFLRLK